MPRKSVVLGMALAISVAATPARAEVGDVARLLAVYPEQLSHIEGNWLVWRDGTRMMIDDGRGPKSFDERLARPDIKDMFDAPYLPGRAGLPPPAGDKIDPGRVRHAAFFAKMYGDCRSGSAARYLVEIVWMAKTAPQKLKVTGVNGVAAKLAAVSSELEALPAVLRRDLTPSAGTYVCRSIAGSDRASAHGLGIAIDIAVKHADYWRWHGGRDGLPGPWRNRIPLEIVEIFERHGFIWGGKWAHYDTMHFEYRPELLKR